MRHRTAPTHGAVLENGAVPLSVLDRHLQRWQHSATEARKPQEDR
jgi:uncharacterized protein (DUF885 family)